MTPSKAPFARTSLVLCAAWFAVSSEGARAQDAAEVPRVVVVKDVPYGPGNDPRTTLDLYRREGTDSRPAVLVIHGGAWSIGSKTSGEAPAFARRLAEAGYVAASAGYRLAPRHPWPAQIEDVRRAVQTLRARAAEWGVDPSRVGATGASAGGHLAAFLCVGDDAAKPDAADPVARFSSKTRCAVSFCGPMDLTLDDADATPAGVRTVVRLLTGSSKYRDADTLDRARRLAPKASPVAFVDADDGPLFLVYGERDPIVGTIHAERMKAACGAAKVPCLVHGVPDGGHGEFLFPITTPEGAAKSDIWTRTLAFLSERLGPPSPVGTSSRPESRPSPKAPPLRDR